jgi:hypothetical protein
MKICIKCHETKTEDNFPFRKDISRYRSTCRSCENTRRYDRVLNDDQKENRKLANRKYARNKNHKISLLRQDPLHRSRFIVEDTRKSDKKRYLDNDLTIEFTEDLIALGCSYCGNTERMTLDRIDNAIGHTKNNVVASCYRCNMIRGNMPYQAWMNIVPAIRNTFEKGLFQGWNSGIWRARPDSDRPITA